MIFFQSNFLSGLFILSSIIYVSGCTSNKESSNDQDTSSITNQMDSVIKPVYVTEKVNYDSDDPAIWINKRNPEKSLIIGTDKMENEGGIFLFDLKGKIVKKVTGIDRPNNVDVAYGLIFEGDTIDIAVCTERVSSKIRVFKLPELELIDDGGIPVFEESEFKQPMGVALYTRPNDKKIFAIVSRKENPENNNDYLWQYELNSKDSIVRGTLVRKFGTYEGSEVEAVAIDNEKGYVYYSDEGFGIRKYYADPDLQNNQQLAIFGIEGFADDHEGISIYKSGSGKGFIIVSDQGANEFHIFPREGLDSDPHEHPLLKVIKLSTKDSDGSEVTHIPLNSDFPEGLFVAMSNDKTFQIYSWADIMK